MTISSLKSLPRFVSRSLFILLLGWCSVGVNADENIADVLIVGAGLSGLSSAYYLKKAGKTAVILEMSPHIGGRIRTANYADNAHAEIGLEEFWEGNPAVDLMRELKIPLETFYTSFSSFYYQGKLYPFTHKSNLEFLQSVISTDEMKAYKKWDQKMVELYKQIKNSPLSKNLLPLIEISFADWLHETSGLSPKTQEFVRIQTEPEYATSWTKISAIDGIAEWNFLSEGQAPYHVVGGNQRAAQAIADFIGSNNIRLNKLVTHIKSTDTGVEVTTSDMGNFQQQIYRAKYVITTVPLFRLNDIQFNPPLSQDRKEAIQTQSGGAYFTAHVLVDNKASHFWKTKDISFLPIISDGPLGVIYEGKTESNNDAVLNLLINGSYAERFNSRVSGGPEDVQEALIEAFEKQWTGFRPSVKQMTFYRYHPHAIASWPVGRSRFDSLSDSLRQPQGRIYFAGDFTEDTHSNGASLSAIRVVKDILKQK